ncbi:Ca2+ regulator and membrane fusion protein Fig1-domain-containing protein [Xylariomycetidae sp. FL0641]|nr:Ca2+ regulator and membrane fusion protein Fig1-domain-containing protein [Xylariomycetidae sp. FL0641]
MAINAQELKTILTSASSNGGDPLNLLRLAEKVRTGVVFYPLIAIALVLTFLATLLLASFPGWHWEEDSEGSRREIKPFPSRSVSYTALAMCFLAATLGLASAFWQHIGAAEVSTTTRLLTYDLAGAEVGTTSMVFAWLAAAAVTVTTMGLLLMVLSIRILTQLSD